MVSSEEGRARPVRVAAFGRKLALLRGKRSAEQVLIRVRTMGVKLTTSTLYQYENGTVEAPDAGVLWALAKIYGVTLDSLISLLVANRNDPNLSSEVAAPLDEAAVVVTDPVDRQLLDSVQRLPATRRDEVLEFIAFRQMRELPEDSRLAYLEQIQSDARKYAEQRASAEKKRRAARR